MSERSNSNTRQLGPLFAASTYVSFRCSVLRPCSLVQPDISVVDQVTIHSFLCPHRPPMLDLTSFLEWNTEFDLYYNFTVAVSSYVVRSFSCFSASIAGRSNAANFWRRLLFILASDLPLGVSSSSSPSLEARRFLPVHQSVGQVISCSGKITRPLVGIYGEVLEALYLILVFFK